MTFATRWAIRHAVAFALRYHAGQTRQGGEAYTEHLRRVAVSCEHLPETYRVVAWLHDILEDTECKEAELRAAFGDEITDAVVALTKKHDEPYHKYLARVRVNPLARKVKFHDIVDNLKSQPHETTRIKYFEALETL